MLFKKKEKQPQGDEKAKPVFKDEDGNLYPTGFKLGLLMGSVFVCMFLVSLVRLGLQQHAYTYDCKLTKPARRTASSSRPLSPASPMISIRPAILAGMARRT